MNRPAQPASVEPRPGAGRGELWLGRFGPGLLVAITLFLLLPGATTWPLLDLDEPLNAQRAREMMAADHWLLPTVNGRPDLTKPPLLYWLLRASYAVLGVNEFAARWPAIMATVGLVLVVNAIGRHWFSVKAGFAAAFVLLTCVQVLLVGGAAVVDLPLALCVAVAEYACFRLLQPHSAAAARCWFIALYGALGLGFLAKGPVAPLVVVLTLVCHRFVFWRRPLAWRNLRLPWGLALFAVIVGAWAVPALIETQGRLWQVGIVEQVLGRGRQPFDDRPYFLGYYAIAALVSLFPWIAFAGNGLTVLRQHWHEHNAWLASWFIGLPVALSFYASQLPHYALPAFPAFFLIVAQTMDWPQRTGRWATRWFWLVMGLGLLGVAGLTALGLVTGSGGSHGPLRTIGLSLAALVAGLTGLALAARSRWLPGIGAALVVAAVAPLGAGSAWRQVAPAAQLQAIFRELPANTECVADGYTGPGLLFYSGRRWVMPPDPNELRAVVAKPGPRLVVLVESRVELADCWRSWLGGTAPPPPRPTDWVAELKANSYRVRRLEGIDTLHPGWMRLVVLIRP